MQNNSGTIKVTGIIAMVFIVIAIVWYILSDFGVGWISSNPEHVVSSLQSVAGNKGQYLSLMFVDVLYNLGILALGALFYLIFRSFNRSLALFGGLTFVIAGTMWLVLDMPAFAQYQLAIDYSNASGATASTIAQRAADLSLWSDYSSAIMAILMAIGLFSFSAIIIRSSAINRLLGWLAVIAGILMLVSLVNTFEGYMVSRIAYNVTELWILCVGLWLVLRGVKTYKGEPVSQTTKV